MSAQERAADFVMRAAAKPQGPPAEPTARAVFASTATSAATYTKGEKLLTIQFTTGKEYEYKKVPKAVWDGYLGAGSKGSYFNHIIRNPLGKFPYRRIF